MGKTKAPELTLWLHLYYTGRDITDKIGILAKPELNPVVETFKENILRALRLSIFPLATYMTGKRFQMAESEAYFKVTGNPFPNKFSHRVPKGVAELRDAMLDGVAESSLPMITLTPNEEEQVFALGDLGNSMVTDVLMPMQIVTAWSALETLFGDLWVSALNAHPHGLSDLKGTKPKAVKSKEKQKQEKPKDDETRTDQQEADDDKDRDFHQKINMTMLQLYDFNLKEKMGTLLRTNVNFTTLDGIKEAYWRAFFDHAGTIHNSLANDHLRYLCEVRNLIVHKSSVCDKEFRDKARRLPGYPRELEPGQRLEFNGQMVHNMLVQPVQCSVDLIKAVDSWIKTH